jgi:molybdopterin-guanine dinucleotide biosynthesis protein A
VSKTSVAILAGGHSRRMGQEKAFLPVGGQPVIQRVLWSIADLSDDLLIVTNTPDMYRHLGQRMVSDVYPGKGALGGVYTAIIAALHPHCLVVACDMPFLNTDLLSHLMTLSAGFDVVIPLIQEFPETMHAIYGKACLEPIEMRLSANQLKIIDFFEDVRVQYVSREEVARYDPTFRSFLNMNTPDDWRKLQRLTAQE